MFAFQPLLSGGAQLLASTGVEVSATRHALTLTPRSATVNATINVAAGTDALVITANAATVKINVNVSAGTDALVLTENAAGVNAAINVAAGTDALVLTEQTATVNAAINVSAGTDALALTPNAASVIVGFGVQATTAALTLTEYTATVNAAINVAAGTDALTLAGLAANVNAAINVTAGTDALILTEHAATVTAAGSGTEVNATVAALVMASYPATVGVPDPVAQTIYFYNPLRIRAEKRAENDERETRSLSRRKALKKVRRIFRIVAEREPELAAEIVGLPVGNLTAALTDNLVVQDRLVNDANALRELYLAYYARQEMEDEDIAALLLAM